VAAARDDDVRVAFARLDEFAVHRLDGREILFDDLIERPAANVGVALDATDQPDVGIRIDEHLHVTQVAHPRVDEEQNTVDDDDISRIHPRVLGAAEMRDEIVLRFVDGHPPAERLKVRTQQVIIEGVGMIPVEFLPLVKREGGEVLVVGVHVNERHRRGREVLGDVPGHGRLTRSGAAGDSDN